MILSMGAGQLDLQSRVSHSNNHTPTIIIICFNDDIKIENIILSMRV